MTTALLIMDVQHGILAGYEPDHEHLTRLADAVSAAHSADIPVVFVNVAFRPGHPEVSDRNLMFAGIKAAGRLAVGSGDEAIMPQLSRRESDVLITKKRVSAFAGSDLGPTLSALRTDHLVLAGVATSGVVLSTVRQAADLDYRITLLADGCRDQDPEVHRVLIEKVFPRQAAVVTVADWIASLTSS